MTIRFKIVMAALTAALVLSLGAGTAAALRSLSITGETRLTLNGPVTFEASVGERTGQIICNTTFTKTISRVIPKIEGTLIGRVTRVDVARPETCRVVNPVEAVNAIRIVGTEKEELWRIFYKTFLGTLPRITGLLFILRNVQVLLEFRALNANVRCLYENGRRPGSVGVLAAVNASGVLGGLRTLNEPEKVATREFDLLTDLELFRVGCPRTARFKAEVTPLQTTTVLLI